MNFSHLNSFDTVVIGIVALSCLFAFFRGLVREILSLAAWVGAGLVTLYYFHPVAQRLTSHFKDPKVAVGIAIVGLYLAALIVFGMVNTIIIKTVKSGGETGMLDNLLGLVFGAARGALVVCLGYALIMFTLAGKEPPEWMAHSVTVPYLEKGSAMMTKIAPEYLQDIASLEKKAVGDADDDKQPPASDDEKETGYSRSATQQLDRLIQNTNQNP